MRINSNQSRITVENNDLTCSDYIKNTCSSHSPIDIDLYALHNSFPEIDCNITQTEIKDTEIQIINELTEIKRRAEEINFIDERINFAVNTINELFPDESELSINNNNSKDTQNDDPLMNTLITISIHLLKILILVSILNYILFSRQFRSRESESSDYKHRI